LLADNLRVLPASELHASGRHKLVGGTGVIPESIPQGNTVVDNSVEISKDVPPFTVVGVDAGIGSNCFECLHHLLSFGEITATLVPPIVPVSNLGLVHLNIEVDSTHGYTPFADVIHEFFDLGVVWFAISSLSAAREPVGVHVIFPLVTGIPGIDGVLEEIGINASSTDFVISSADVMGEALFVSFLERCFTDCVAGINAFDDFSRRGLSGYQRGEENDSKGVEWIEMHMEEIAGDGM